MSHATIRIGRDEHVWSFDDQREPVAHVHVGNVIEIETPGCLTGQVRREADTVEKIDLSRVSRATGAIGVRMVCEEASKLLVNEGDSAPRTPSCSSRSPATSAWRRIFIPPGWFVARMRRAQAGVESRALSSLIS